MTSIQGIGRRVTVALAVAAAAAVVVGPAVAASKDDCAPMQDELFAVATPAAQARLLANDARLETIQLHHKVMRAELVRVRELAELRGVLSLDRDALITRDRDLKTLELKRFRTVRHADESTRGSHPLTIAIDVFGTFARLPAQAVITLQQLVEGLAKVTPRVLRAVL